MTYNEKVELYVNKLGLSTQEAEQLIKDENTNNLPKQTAEQKKASKSVRNATSGKPKASTKQKKVDSEKAYLIKFLRSALDQADGVADINVTNAQRIIEFKINGRKMTITLQAPRT